MDIKYNTRKYITKRDIYFILILIVLSSVGCATYLMQGNEDNKTAQILVGGKLVKSICLNSAKEQEFQISEKPNFVFIIKNHSIGVKSSDCPDKVCVQVGMMQKHGESAICIPNNTILQIISSK